MSGPSSTRSLAHGILKATAAVWLAHMLLKLASVALTIVLGRTLPTRIYEVVYAVAFEGCLFSLFLVGEEVIGPAFLPVFMRERDERGVTPAWRFANTVLTVQFLALAAITALIMLFPDAVIRLFTAWRPETEPDRFALASASLARLAPALVCFSLGSTTYMLLNAHKRFFLAGFGDAAWKIATLSVVGVGAVFLGLDERAVIAGLLLGGAAKLATHLLGLRPEWRMFRPRLDLRSPAVRAFGLLVLPLIAGVVFAKVRDVFNNVTVLSRLDAEGLIQANSFGRKLYVTVGWLIPYALSIAMFPFLCELVDRDNRREFGRILSQSARMLLSVFVPLSAVCAVLAWPLSFVLFKGGEFSDLAVRRTALSTACYVLVLPAAAVEYLLMQAFFATRRMIGVTVVGLACSALSVAISYLGVVRFEARGMAALAVVAAGFTLSRTVKSVVLILVLKRHTPFFPFRETAGFLARLCVVAALAAAACALTRVAWAPLGLAGRVAVMAELAVCGCAAAGVFVAGVRWLRIEEPGIMLNWALERVRARRSGRAPAAPSP